jgi:hypothetical protein
MFKLRFKWPLSCKIYIGIVYLTINIQFQISEVSTHEEETKRLLLNSFQADQQETFTTMQEFEEVLKER